jgi:hypothetical protein
LAFFIKLSAHEGVEPASGADEQEEERDFRSAEARSRAAKADGETAEAYAVDPLLRHHSFSVGYVPPLLSPYPFSPQSSGQEVTAEHNPVEKIVIPSVLLFDFETNFLLQASMPVYSHAGIRLTARNMADNGQIG